MRTAIALTPMITALGACQWVGGEDYVDRRSGNLVYAEWDRRGGAVSLSECANDEVRNEISVPPWNQLRSVHDNRRMPLRHYIKSTFFECGTPEKDAK